jgi:hypothetical protein
MKAVILAFGFGTRISDNYIKDDSILWEQKPLAKLAREGMPCFRHSGIMDSGRAWIPSEMSMYWKASGRRAIHRGRFDNSIVI